MGYMSRETEMRKKNQMKMLGMQTITHKNVHKLICRLDMAEERIKKLPKLKQKKNKILLTIIIKIIEQSTQKL